MRASKRNRALHFVLLLPLMGCATSTYRVLNSGEYGTELSVSPDRVLLECEILHDADEPGLAGFMIHVLDEENTVLSLVQGGALDEKSCERRIKRISEILRKGNRIYIAGTGDLNDPGKKGKAYAFPKKGTFDRNGRVLGFVAIANEQGACYDAYSGEEKPCPRDPFPLKPREE